MTNEDVPPQTSRRAFSRPLAACATSYELLYVLSASVLALALAVPVLRLWNANLGVPMAYQLDAPGGQMLIKGILEHGWYFHNPQLGAPFGQELYDFPVLAADTLNVLLVKFLGLFTSNSASVVNLYFLLGFPLIALSSFLVLRRLTISRPAALVCSLLYVLLPYHVARGEYHLFLSAYYAVPLGAYLVLAVLSGEALFVLREDGRGGRLFGYASRRSLATLALCLVVASAAGSVSYAAFTIVLVVLAAAVRFALRPERQTLATGAALVTVIGGVVLLQLVPTIVYRASHGSVAVANRQPQESETYGLNLADLVLPVEDHRLDPLADLTGHYRSTTPVPSEGGQTLGLVGTIGFCWLLAVLVLGMVGRGRRRPQDAPARRLAGAALLAFLVGTTGGVGTVIAYLLTPQIRVWNRLSIFIAFFSLAAVGLLLDRLGVRMGTSIRARRLFALALASVLALGVLDQTSSMVPPYGRIATQYASDARFVAAIEHRLPPRALVYQLPYLSFPEAPLRLPYALVPEALPQGVFFSYDPAKAYLHSRQLRWSFGAIKGRAADWSAALSVKPVNAALPGIVAAGFQGIYVDRFGYQDNGVAAERELRRSLGAPLVSANGRLLFFDLHPYAEQLRSNLSRVQMAALRTVTLYPVRVSWGDDFWGVEVHANHTWRWTKRRRASLELENPSKYVRTVALTVVVANGAPAAAQVLVVYPDGDSSSVRVTPHGNRIHVVLRLHPGKDRVRFETNSAPALRRPQDPRPSLYLRLIDPTMTDTTFLPLFGGNATVHALFGIDTES